MNKKDVRTIKLHHGDNVLICLDSASAGTWLSTEDVVLVDEIPAGHKVAVNPIPMGAPIFKYSRQIGVASRDIAPGEHVHEHNCAIGDYSQQSIERGIEHSGVGTPVVVRPEKQATFQGYVRANGQVGTRNYIGILTSVNCSATVARQAAACFTAEHLSAYPNVDGVVALTHGGGCAVDKVGEGIELLQRVLAGYINHPNFAAVVVVGLGCETNQIQSIREKYQLGAEPTFSTLNIQDVGGSLAARQQIIEFVNSALPLANEAGRESVAASHLTLALQCGGSDAFSGITANPALGIAADILVSHGGTAIISETPEIYGAEYLLTSRASTEVADKLTARIHWWEEYTRRNGGSLDNNPSFGNKLGGLTTILEKSLGAVAKAGSTPLRAFYQYAEPIMEHGLVMMDSPGYDPCSVTGQIASGANLVCFTTGRGSVAGFKPVPCIKLCSNSNTYRMMELDMDINCGRLLDESMSPGEMGAEIFQKILSVASGEPTRSEAQGFGDNEFVPWALGAIT